LSIELEFSKADVSKQVQLNIFILIVICVRCTKAVIQLLPVYFSKQHFAEVHNQSEEVVQISV
jgi:hypothetical protein